MKRNATFSIKAKEVKKVSYLIDAKGAILGRLAVKAANILRGKNKVTFTPHMDCGDNLVVINASLVKLSGKKEKAKTYFKHSGYPHGMKVIVFEDMIKRDPKKVVRQAVAGMLPKGRLGRMIIKNMKVFVDENHNLSEELIKA
ncbi:50S ribosomal protein L13 [Candidatus Margulisiibacteriota bacterium]